MGKQIKNKNDKMNPFLWFIIAVIIPILLAIVLAFIVFSIAGFNITDWVKDKAASVPVVSSIITTDEESDMENRDVKLESLLTKKDEEIEYLNDEVANLEGTVDQLEKDLLKMEKKSSNEKEDKKDNELESNTEGLSIKQMSSSFKDMDAKQAALIVQSLDTDTAISLLETMPSKVRGSILEAMKPEKAADLTKLIIEE